MVWCKVMGRYLRGQKIKLKVCPTCPKKIWIDRKQVCPLVRAGKETFCLLSMSNHDWVRAFNNEVERVLSHGSVDDKKQLCNVLEKALEHRK